MKAAIHPAYNEIALCAPAAAALRSLHHKGDIHVENLLACHPFYRQAEAYDNAGRVERFRGSMPRWTGEEVRL